MLPLPGPTRMWRRQLQITEYHYHKQILPEGGHVSTSRVEKLCHGLQEAKLDDLIVTLHGVELDEEEKDATTLGPTLTTVLTVKNTPVEAMINTVTVISLEFLLKTLASQCPTEQSAKEWMNKV